MNVISSYDNYDFIDDVNYIIDYNDIEDHYHDYYGYLGDDYSMILIANCKRIAKQYYGY